ncbi:putative quinol monooxygenase [Neorhodopirellula pilleata]|uniref:Autoinducer 2-degrading protein LsrG n=1 Tax=Neorhodopirellula pilleata TaxID=2714738 RepID=A0A5C6A2D5_9BACT|nr:putative quinol monooxygenase [Neorhodopirellula pilleata]TWT93576.1 Autoinducer 2-degrading protein LsrG [Neorhodopirellula pilleata]
MIQPTFAVAVTFRIHSQWIDAFTKRVIQQAQDSVEREPGCCQFDVLVDESDPNVIFLYETYLDADAFAEHRETDHFHDFDQQVTPWIELKSVRRLNLMKG